jgi:hypothetical protein
MAHNLRDHADEVGPVLPIEVLKILELKVRLMHQRGCLQRVVWPFAA